MIIHHTSRVAQWKRAGPITQRSMDRHHFLLEISSFIFYLCRNIFTLIVLLEKKIGVFMKYTMGGQKKVAPVKNGLPVS